MTNHQEPGSGSVPLATNDRRAPPPHAGAKCSFTWTWSASTTGATSWSDSTVLALMMATCGLRLTSGLLSSGATLHARSDYRSFRSAVTHPSPLYHHQRCGPAVSILLAGLT